MYNDENENVFLYLNSDNAMIDTYRHQGLRRKLVQEIKEKGIKDEKVLEAIMKIPRHYFLESAFEKYAYSNEAFPIGAGQTISHPFTVAYQTELLKVKKGDKILEIGTGSGFQTAVLCELGAKVYTIERQKLLYTKSKAIIAKLGYHAKQFFGDGYKGLPSYQPYDSIIVTCGAPFIPEDLLHQLKVGGRMVIPVGGDEGQEMNLILKQGDYEFEREELGSFAFVPMLKDRNLGS